MIARSTSWRCLAIILVCLAAQTGATPRALAQNAANEQRSYILGTATTGGTYHPVGVALSTLIKLKLLPTFNVDLTAVNTAGSQENVGLLRQGEVQFAILSALAAHEARTGTGEFAATGPDEDLRAITTLWLSTDHFVVRKEAVQSGTIDDFLNLRGSRVSLGREDSGTLLENRTLLAALGVDIDTDFEAVELGYSESTEALIAGEIDGMSLAGGLPVGAVQSTLDTLGEDAVVLEFSDDQLRLIDQGRGLWTRAVIPAYTYPNQSREIFTVGSPNILAVRADVDDEVVYQITKTIFEELDYLHGLHAATQQISLENAVTDLPLPVHEGAIRYFKEKGVELPPPPVEVDPNLLVRYDGAAQARDGVNRGVITLFTGTDGETATRTAAELSSMLNAADDNVRLLPTYGGGMAQNLTDLLYLKGVDAALVRADILAYAERENVYPVIGSQIAYITEMFPEEVHLVVRDDIASLDDLAGKTINVGVPGSGVDITASIILAQLGLRVETTAFNAYEALNKLRRGELAGAFFVGGKPMPLLREIESGSGLHLLALPFVQYDDSYRPAKISAGDYPHLMTPDDEVGTVAVRTALLTYAWRADSARYNALTDFTNAFLSHLLELQQAGRHPKWREVDPTSAFAGWPRFEPARLWIDDNPGTAQRIALEGRKEPGRSEAAPTPPPIDAALTPPSPRPRAPEPAAIEPPPQSAPEAVQAPEPPLSIERERTEPDEALPAVSGTASTEDDPVAPSGGPLAKELRTYPASAANAPTF